MKQQNRLLLTKQLLMFIFSEEEERPISRQRLRNSFFPDHVLTELGINYDIYKKIRTRPFSTKISHRIIKYHQINIEEIEEAKKNFKKWIEKKYEKKANNI